LILQGGIIIPTECIFEDKMGSAPDALIKIVSSNNIYGLPTVL